MSGTLLFYSWGPGLIIDLYNLFLYFGSKVFVSSYQIFISICLCRLYLTLRINVYILCAYKYMHISVNTYMYTYRQINTCVDKKIHSY